jgi:hypothetical protein
VKKKEKLKRIKGSIEEMHHEVDICDCILSEIREIDGFGKVAISTVRSKLWSLMDGMKDPVKYQYD